MAEARDGQQIRLVISDVDGTLVTKDKVLTPAVAEAVRRLQDAGILFTITSSRPPLGLKKLIDALAIAQPVAAINGGLITGPDMRVVEQKLLPPQVAELVIATIVAYGLDVWLYTDFEWFVRDPDAPHVARECYTVNFSPTVVKDFTPYLNRAAKIVGVSDDAQAVARGADGVRQACGVLVSATCSQPYYLDVTHPDANKGQVVTTFSQMLGIPAAQIATIGDGLNDILMFEKSGVCIAMGNACPEVQQAAQFVTVSNAEDGFARAIETFILARGAAALRKAS